MAAAPECSYFVVEKEKWCATEKKTTKSWSDADLKAAIVAVKNGKGIREAAKTRQVNRETLRRHVQKCIERYGSLQEMDVAEFCNGSSLIVRDFTFKPVFSQEEEDCLKDYLLECNALGYGVGTRRLRELAYEFAVKNGKTCPESWVKNNMAGDDWRQLFFKRYPMLSLRKGENCSLARVIAFNKPNVSRFFDNLQSLYERFPDIVTKQRIYNLDETATTTVQGPRMVIATKGQKQVSINASGERRTLVTTCAIICASGEMLPPAMIFPRVHFKKAMLIDGYPGTLGLAGPSGWMTAPLYLEVLRHFIRVTHSSKENPSILIKDNHESHVGINVIDLAKANGVHIVTLVPHTSHRQQPLDRTVYGPFKKHYNNEVSEWMFQHPKMPVSIYEVAGFVNKALVKAATTQNILSGFKSTGILPFNREIFTDADFAPCRISDEPDPAEGQEEADDSQNSEEPAVVSSSSFLSPISSLVDSTLTESRSTPASSSHESRSTPASSSHESRSTPASSSHKSPGTGSIETVQVEAGAKKIITPQDIFGLPVCKEGTRRKKGGRPKKKSIIATDTPVRDAIAEEQSRKRTKASKKNSKAAKRVLFNDDSSDHETNESVQEEEMESEHEIGMRSLTVESFTKLPRDPKKGDFVLVQFPATTGSRRDAKRAQGGRDYVFFVAEVIQDIDDDRDVEVSYLRSSQKTRNAFVYPRVPDLACVSVKDVKVILPEPSNPKETDRLKSLLKFEIDFSKLRMG